MRYVAAALAAFKLDQVVKEYVSAPPWAFHAAITGASALLTVAFGGKVKYALAVAAGAGLLYRFDSLMMTTADAAKVAVLRSSRR